MTAKNGPRTQTPMAAAEMLAELANTYLVSWQSLGEPIRPKDVALLLTENWRTVSRAAHSINIAKKEGTLPPELQREEVK